MKKFESQKIRIVENKSIAFRNFKVKKVYELTENGIKDDTGYVWTIFLSKSGNTLYDKWANYISGLGTSFKFKLVPDIDYFTKFVNGKMGIDIEHESGDVKGRIKDALNEFGYSPYNTDTLSREIIYRDCDDIACDEYSGRVINNSCANMTAQQFLDSYEKNHKKIIKPVNTRKKSPLEYYMEDYLGFEDGDKVVIEGFSCEYYKYVCGELVRPDGYSISVLGELGAILTMKRKIERYVEPVVENIELTMEEIAEKLGVDVERLRIKSDEN